MTLRAFRMVEAQINELERLEQAVTFARRLVREAKNEVQLASAAKQVEDVAREVQMAEALNASGATAHDNEALVDICASESMEAQDAWVQELSTMYLGWAQKRGYEAMLVAEAENPARVVVRIAGPGAYGFLAGEAGMHRRIEDEKRQRAYVRVHRGGVPEEQENLDVEGRPVKTHEGSFLERVRTEVTVKDASTGRVHHAHRLGRAGRDEGHRHARGVRPGRQHRRGAAVLRGSRRPRGGPAHRRGHTASEGRAARRPGPLHRGVDLPAALPSLSLRLERHLRLGNQPGI